MSPIVVAFRFSSNLSVNRWLKEGFANYMETLATDFVEPLWMQEKQFVAEKIFAFMELDSLPTSRPISIDSTNPADIFQMYDSIT